MVQCCVPNCGNNNNNTQSDKVSFHEFPNNLYRCMQWVDAIGIPKCNPYKGSRVCSQHFREEDFSYFAKMKRLKRNAVPSIFECFTVSPEESNEDEGKRERLVELWGVNSIVSYGKPQAKRKTSAPTNVVEVPSEPESDYSTKHQSNPSPPKRSRLSPTKSPSKKNPKVPLTQRVASIAVRNNAFSATEPKAMRRSVRNRRQTERFSPESDRTVPQVHYSSPTTITTKVLQSPRKRSKIPVVEIESDDSPALQKSEPVTDKDTNDLCDILKEILQDAKQKNPHALLLLKNVKNYRKAKAKIMHA